MTGSPWWVGVLLLLYPEDFRRDRGQEVQDFVRVELLGAGTRRRRVAIRMAADLAMGAVRARSRRPRRGQRGRGDRGEGWAMRTLHDSRLVMRSLRREPGFVGLVVATLALGVGLNTALFSVVNGVLLRPLPYPDSGRLVYLEANRTVDDVNDVLVSGGDWRELRRNVAAFDALEAVATVRQNLNGAGLPRQVQVGWVSPGFPAMLGARPVLGRLFRPDDPPGTAVLSHALWQGALGGDPSVLGRVVELDGHPHTVIGIMPPDFRLELPRRGGTVPPVEIWKNPDTFWQNGDVWNEQGPEFGLLRLVGRLRADVSVKEAQAQLDAVTAAMTERDGRYRKAGFQITIQGLQDWLVAQVRPTLLLLVGAVSLVLLIACANVANLLLVRAQSRRRELAVRLALGSPRRRIGALLLQESFLLALLGAAVGMGVAFLFVQVVPTLAPPELPRISEIGIDGRAFGHALATAVITTLLVGLAPAVAASRTDPSRDLGNGRADGGRGGRARDALVIVQVALSLVLLCGAALLTGTMMRLQRVEPGFAPEGLFTFGVSIPGAKYGWPEEAGRFYRQVEARVAELPDVEAAGVVWPMPFSGTWSGDHEAGDGEVRALGLVPYYLATESYFTTARIPLLEGRLFRDGDPRFVTVVSRRVAERAFPGRSALGRTIRANPWGGGMQDFTVVGIVGDIRDQDLREPSLGGMYFDARSWSWVDWEVHVVARTDVPSASLVPTLREAVAKLDPDVPLAHPEPMAALLSSQTASVRFVLALLVLFASSAGALAVVGLYGVVSYGVGLRRREIGIRMALGSAKTRITRMVVGHGVALAAVGVAVGLGGALLLGGVLESMLYGVRPRDPVTLVAVGALMGLAATVASWLPARRAARTDPAEVLRSE